MKNKIEIKDNTEYYNSLKIQLLNDGVVYLDGLNSTEYSSFKIYLKSFGIYPRMYNFDLQSSILNLKGGKTNEK